MFRSIFVRLSFLLTIACIPTMQAHAQSTTVPPVTIETPFRDSFDSEPVPPIPPPAARDRIPEKPFRLVDNSSEPSPFERPTGPAPGAFAPAPQGGLTPFDGTGIPLLECPPTAIPNRAQERQPPFAVDYIFLAKSDVKDTNGDFGMSTIKTSYTWARPFLEENRLLFSVKPGFEVTFLSGPNGNGPLLPEQVYALTLGLSAVYRFGERTRLILGATPGLYTDFDDVQGEAFRVPAMALISYDYSERLTLSGGLIYTGQTETPLVPALGATWRPNELWDFELMFPRPRIIYHFSDNLDVYGLFQFNTQVYSVDTPLGHDLLQYRDLRFAGGVEYSPSGGPRLSVETGISFGREIQLDRQIDRDIDPTFYLRIGGKF